ncbi:uncharacterized membrane protein YoaK (UPF0700 family) [Novosphingobium kunmingense]|uniref:Uncharacterized membrane protein YoaK (UPF0700 family) n=1 Tax=Novosphingobium kunmingense TaxID=1211806 RepID=A0A2N0H531_9SPHN|nr:DUF1275 family protein [Novosphingobium kunmingense]PKB14048.1 uncharacterized membrane protein YoaK (UPF0700 family) [Novosphingobium kunmingense]
MQAYDRPRQALAVAAAMLAGCVDAVGFLSGDRYFVSFMSGNTTRLGIDVATAPPTAVVPLMLIAGFVAGVVGGALIATVAGARRKSAVLATVALLLAGAAGANAAGFGALTLGLLVLAMGAINNTFQRGGEVAVGLTYMTGALVRFGQGLAAHLLGRGGEGWSLWLVLWLGLALGAVVGATGWLHAPLLTLWGAATWAGVLGLAALRLPNG